MIEKRLRLDRVVDRLFYGNGDFRALENNMSLRLKLNLLVSGLIIVFVGVVLAFQVADTRAIVHEEVTASHVVGTKLLTYFLDPHIDASTPTVLRALRRLGHIRSTTITLHDRHGHIIYTSPPSPYKAGQRAPQWFSALVTSAPLHKQLHLAHSTLNIQTNASRVVLDGWNSTVREVGIGVLMLVLGNLLVSWLIGRAVRPFRIIAEGLKDMQRGAYQKHLPAFKGAEAGSIARAFNDAAQAITDNINARRDAAEAAARLAQSRQFATAIQRRLDQERREIARELHDEAGQSITAIRSMALALQQRIDVCDGPTHEALRTIADTSGQLYDAVHKLIPRLHPPALDSVGLAETLDDTVATWRRQQPSVAFKLRVDVLPDHLDPGYALAAYRIVQEAVTNALRHANAQCIDIALDCADHVLIIEVHDNGRGLLADWQRPGHYGVRGMFERARILGGTVEVGNHANGGACVRARLPLT